MDKLKQGFFVGIGVGLGVLTLVGAIQILTMSLKVVL